MQPIAQERIDRAAKGHVWLYSGGIYVPDVVDRHGNIVELGYVKGGELVDERENTIQNLLYSRSAKWLASNTPNGGTAVKGPGYIAVGTGSGAITTADASPGLFFEIWRNPITSAGVLSTYTARLVATFTSTQANPFAGTSLLEMGLFDYLGFSGLATAGTATTLTDSTATWPSLIGWKVNIYDGTGRGQSATITANTTTQITVASWSIATPTNTSKYCLVPPIGTSPDNSMYAHVTISVPKVSGNTLNCIWQITEPSF